MSLGVALVSGATVAVTVVPAPTMPVRIDHATGTFTCSAPSCVVELTPGRYRVRAGTRDQLVSIDGPTTLESRAARPTTRTVTLVLGLVGSAAALAGQIGWVVSFQRDVGHGTADLFDGPRTGWFLLSTLGIMVATPSWIVFALSGERIRLRPTPRIGAFGVPVSGGGLFALDGVF